jgi:hypothetical protein
MDIEEKAPVASKRAGQSVEHTEKEPPAARQGAIGVTSPGGDVFGAGRKKPANEMSEESDEGGRSPLIHVSEWLRQSEEGRRVLARLGDDGTALDGCPTTYPQAGRT